MAYDSEVSKITYCLSYMKEGSAPIWSNNVVQAMRTGMGEGAYQTWTEFENAVTMAFKGRAQVEIAQAKMEHLRQETGTATAFFTCSTPSIRLQDTMRPLLFDSSREG